MKTLDDSKINNPVALATAVTNAAQDKNEEYQFNGIVQGKTVILSGIGYQLGLFQINGAEYGTTPDDLPTRTAFKNYIINSINGA